MKHPQIVIVETDGLLARLLEQPLAAFFEQPPPHRRWLLRESRQAPACLSLLRDGGPSVLVLKLGRNLIRELELLNEVHTLLPDVPVIMVGDAADPALQALAYDLGATYVLLPPEPRPGLIELVTQTLVAEIERYTAPAAERGPQEDA